MSTLSSDQTSEHQRRWCPLSSSEPSLKYRSTSPSDVDVNVSPTVIIPICRFYSTMQCTIVQSAVLRLHIGVCPSVCLSVCVVLIHQRLSVTLVDQDHTGWKSWKQLSKTSSLFVAQAIHLFLGEHWEILGRQEVG